MARAALLTLLGLLGGAPAAAAEPTAAVFSVEAGDTVEVDVATFDRVLTWDDDRVHLVATPPYQLRATAQARLGPTVVHLIGPDGVQVVVFEVLPSSSGVDSESSVAAGPGPVLSSSTAAWFQGSGTDLDSMEVRHETTLRGEGPDPWELRGELTLGPTSRPVLRWARLQYEERHFRAFVGRSTWLLGQGAAATPLDSVEGTWKIRGGSAVGARVGASTLALGAFAGAPVLAEAMGSWAIVDGIVAEGSAWIWAEPDGPVRPGGRLGGRWEAGVLSGRLSGYWSGAGGGGDASVRLATPRFSVGADGSYGSAGVFVPGFAPAAHVWSSVILTATPWRPLHLVAGGTFNQSLPDEGQDRRSASLWGGLVANPWPQGQVSARYQFSPTWTRPAGEWSLDRAQHSVLLDAAHQGPRLRARGSGWLTVGKGPLGFSSLQLRAGGQARVAKYWWPGGEVSVSQSLGLNDASLVVRGLLERSADDWSVSSWAGLSFTGSPLIARPSVGANLRLTVARWHRIDLGGSFVFGAGPVSWSGQVGYVFDGPLARGDRVPFGGRIVGLLFEDEDGNGRRDDGEEPVGGVPVVLDEGQRSVVANDQGRFAFLGLSAEPHAVRVRSIGWTATEPPETTVVRKLRRKAVEVGIRGTARIVGRPFVDLDQNGLFGIGEQLLSSGRVVVVDAHGGPVGDAGRDTGWEVEGVPQGYSVVTIDLADVPPGYVPSGPVRAEVDSDPGAYTVVPFPFRALHSVSGRVVVDADADGVISDADPPAVGIAVRCAGVEGLTDQDGRYLLRDLPPGAHPVEAEGVWKPGHVRIDQGPGEWFDVDLLIGPRPPGDVDPSRTPRAAPPSPEVALSLTTLSASSDVLLLTPGQTHQVALYASWSDGSWRDVAPDASWVSSDPTVVTVDPGGATGLREGHAELVATYDGRRVRVEVDVAAVQVVGLLLSSPGVDLTPGGSTVLTARGILTTGAIEDMTARVEWTTSDPAVATVAADGTVTAVGPGTCEVRASLRGVQAYPAKVVVR